MINHVHGIIRTGQDIINPRRDCLSSSLDLVPDKYKVQHRHRAPSRPDFSSDLDELSWRKQGLSGFGCYSNPRVSNYSCIMPGCSDEFSCTRKQSLREFQIRQFDP